MSQGALRLVEFDRGARATRLPDSLAILSIAKYLIIVRQSGPQAVALLSKMLERTLTSHTGVPGWQKIRALGVTPLYDRKNFSTFWDLPDGGRATLFEIEGTYVLLVLGSAAARNVALSDVDDPTENAVVELYKRVLSALQPEQVLIGPFDRLVRAQRYAYPTFEAFQRTVGILKCDEARIDFAHGAESKWFDLVDDATKSHRRLLQRTADGSTSMIRANLWPKAGFQAPVGFTRDKYGEFVIIPEEVRVIEAIIEQMAGEDRPRHDTGRWLLEEDLLPPMRHGDPTFRRLHGEHIERRDYADEDRAHQIVTRVLRSTPDLAMNKLVRTWKESSSAEILHLGARPIRISDSKVANVFVWDLPDILGGVDDDMLLRFVEMGARARVQTGLSPSAWLDEKEERARVREIIDSQKGTIDYQKAARWAGEHGELLDSMGGGEEHPRTPRVCAVLDRVVATAPTPEPRLASDRLYTLLVNLPVWEDGIGNELRLSTRLKNYAILCRPADPTCSTRFMSLARAWGTVTADDKRLIASVQPMALHAEMARAAALAIENGADVLCEQHTASSLLTDVFSAGSTDRARALLAQENEVKDATQKAETASDSLMRLRAQMTEDENSEGSHGSRGGAGASSRLEYYESRERRAWEELDAAKDRLAALREENVSLPEVLDLPELNDMDLLLDTLANLATTEKADARTVRALRALIPRFELAVHDPFEVSFSFDMLVPGADGGDPILVGPITGTVPTCGSKPPGYQSWAHAFAEDLCLRRLALTRSPWERPGRELRTSTHTRARDLLINYLTSRGMSNATANAVWATRILLVRTILWNDLHGLENDPMSLGVDPSYIVRVLMIYKQERIALNRGEVELMFERQVLLDALVESEGLLTTELVKLVAASTIRSAEQLDGKIARDLRTPPSGRTPFVRYKHERVAGKRARTNRWFPLTCPHCSTPEAPHFVDTVVWEPEVSDGQLCSNCMRSPSDALTIFPDAYLTLNRTLETRAA